MNKFYTLILIITFFVTSVGYSMSEIYCRYKFEDQIHYGQVEDNLIYELDKAPWLGGKKTGATVQLDKIKLLHPSEPEVILGLGGAYKQAGKEGKPPNTVRWFLKPPGAAASPNEDVIIPVSLDEVKVETELVIVIGRTIKDADENEAGKAIFGYTIGNDVVGNKTSFLRLNETDDDTEGPLLGPGLKICDKFAPFGPFIYTGIDYNNRPWILTVSNAETGKKIIEENNTKNLYYTPEKIVSDLSKVLTLNPGDIIFTGTSKSLVAADGDEVTVQIEGLGVLKNRIVGKPN